MNEWNDRVKLDEGVWNSVTKKHVRGEMIEGRKEEKLAIRSGNSGMFMKTTITTQLFCLTITVWQS